LIDVIVATSDVAFWHITPLGLCITFVALERSGHGPRHQWMPWTNAVLNDRNASLNCASLACGEGAPMTETRKLAAILAADIAGYSKLAGSDEERTLARLRALRSDLFDPTIALHHGRVVKRTGDGILIEFRSVVDAVRCAIEVQNGMVERNAAFRPSVASISASASTSATWSRRVTAT
jgi:class 3 adenylate cyclase